VQTRLKPILHNWSESCDRESQRQRCKNLQATNSAFRIKIISKNAPAYYSAGVAIVRSEGTDVMIFCKILIITLVFKEKRQFFRRKLAKNRRKL
jgi:hypothetical protein